MKKQKHTVTATFAEIAALALKRGPGQAKAGGAAPAGKTTPPKPGPAPQPIASAKQAAHPSGGKVTKPTPSKKSDAAAKTAPRATAARYTPKPKRIGALDAAFQVLREAGKPLTCGDIMERMLKKQLWKTGGKTPAATLSAAIGREIKEKKGEARFRKAGRGLYTAGKAAPQQQKGR